MAWWLTTTSDQVESITEVVAKMSAESKTTSDQVGTIADVLDQISTESLIASRTLEVIKKATYNEHAMISYEEIHSDARDGGICVVSFDADEFKNDDIFNYDSDLSGEV